LGFGDTFPHAKAEVGKGVFSETTGRRKPAVSDNIVKGKPQAWLTSLADYMPNLSVKNMPECARHTSNLNPPPTARTGRSHLF
jgi:hypothetical protein